MAIKVKVEGSIEWAIRHFKKRCIDSGLFNEIKRTAFYEKPSDIKRRDGQKRDKTIVRLNLTPAQQKKLAEKPRKKFGHKSAPRPPSS
jgi:ribosomal protein S21